jgi:hypothetical protein
LVTKHEPDILVLDQIDKVRVDGDFNRGDERIKELYVSVRELAKEKSMGVVGISQLSADAHEKQITDFSMLENSKTGKAAEADLIFCLGQLSQNGSRRTLNIPKNKISGNHNNVEIILQQELSRFTS